MVAHCSGTAWGQGSESSVLSRLICRWSRKARFVAHDYNWTAADPLAFLPDEIKPNAQYPLFVTTVRTQTTWQSGYTYRWLKVLPARSVPYMEFVVNPRDAAKAGLQDGDWAELTNQYSATQGVVNVSDQVPPGLVSAIFGWQGRTDSKPTGDPQFYANNLLLSVKGGGHNVAGNAVNDGGLVIDLSQMRGVHVDPSTQTVRLQGGATWGDCDRETQLFGLAVPGGVVSTTGIGGLTLHGGVGHLRRKYGLSIDSLLSVDIVTADGQLRRASVTENEDLFWAVRGAGSNFGVVTSFEFQAHPVGPMVMVGAVFYPLEEMRAIMSAWRDYMASAPEELSSLALCWNVPPGEPFPPEHHGKAVFIVAAAYAGSVEDGEPIVQPLRELGEPLIDLSGPWPWLGLQSGFDALFPKGGLYYWKSRALAELSAEAIDEIADYAARRPTPITDIVTWHHGGAMSRVGETETAYGGRDAGFLITGEVSWADPAQTEEAIAWGREFWGAMERHSTGGVYLNFPGLGEEKEALVRAGYGVNYERLVELKKKYDPTNLFRMNLNIPPAS